MLKIRPHNLERLVDDIKRIVKKQLSSFEFIQYSRAEVYEFYEEDVYGEDFYENLIEILFYTLPKNPEIKIVSDFDDICKKCNNRTEECKLIDENVIEEVQKRGLEIGNSYSAKKILEAFNVENEIIEKYFEKK